MRKIQRADAELYQAFFTHKFCGRANKKAFASYTQRFTALAIKRDAPILTVHRKYKLPIPYVLIS